MNEAIKILYVEDDEIDQQAFKRMVEKEMKDAELTIAGSVGKAREELEQNAFDIIVTDFKLGDGTAFDVLGIQQEIPVIITTGAGDEKTAVKAMKKGAVDYIVKDMERIYLNNLPGVMNKVLEKHGLLVDKQRAEEALEKSEEKYRLLTESTNDIIYSSDIEGTLDYISPQVERYGINRDELLSKSIIEYVLPEDQARVEEDFFQTMTTGEEFPTVFRIKDTKDKIHWLEDQGKLVKDKDGNIIGITGVLRDITERKKAEKALKESEERFRDLFENANDLILSVGMDGSFHYVNEAWKRTMGYTIDEIEKLKIFDIISPDHLEECQNLFQMVFQGEEISGIETAFLAKDGRIIHIEGNVNCKFEDGQPVATRAIFRDVTARVKAEDELKGFITKLEEANTKLVKADHMKDKFLSITSHELRNPLAGLIGVLELIQDGLYKDEQELKEFINTMHNTSKDMLETLNDLLDLQRIESGKMEKNIDEVKVDEVLDEIYLLYGRKLEAKGLRFNIEKPEESSVMTDRKMLTQVLRNLVGNAVKFTEKGQIRVTAKKEHEMMNFRVEDSGSGISEKDISKLFQPFSQASNTGTKVKGSGLGLAICKSIIENLGGEIWIESDGKGKGTTVMFTIPVSPEQTK